MTPLSWYLVAILSTGQSQIVNDGATAQPMMFSTMAACEHVIDTRGIPAPGLTFVYCARGRMLRPRPMEGKLTIPPFDTIAPAQPAMTASPTPMQTTPKPPGA